MSKCKKGIYGRTFSLYILKPSYGKFLEQVKTNVLTIKGQKSHRLYIGPFKVKDEQYLIPLSSNKLRHKASIGKFIMSDSKEEMELGSIELAKAIPYNKQGIMVVGLKDIRKSIDDELISKNYLTRVKAEIKFIANNYGTIHTKFKKWIKFANKNRTYLGRKGIKLRNIKNKAKRRLLGTMTNLRKLRAANKLYNQTIKVMERLDKPLTPNKELPNAMAYMKLLESHKKRLITANTAAKAGKIEAYSLKHERDNIKSMVKQGFDFRDIRYAVCRFSPIKMEAMKHFTSMIKNEINKANGVVNTKQVKHNKQQTKHNAKVNTKPAADMAKDNTGTDKIDSLFNM